MKYASAGALLFVSAHAFSSSVEDDCEPETTTSYAATSTSKAVATSTTKAGSSSTAGPYYPTGPAPSSSIKPTGGVTSGYPHASFSASPKPSYVTITTTISGYSTVITSECAEETEYETETKPTGYPTGYPTKETGATKPVETHYPGATLSTIKGGPYPTGSTNGTAKPTGTKFTSTSYPTAVATAGAAIVKGSVVGGAVAAAALAFGLF